MKIGNGRYWNEAWSLVEGCTPCSPGCERCWLMSMERRFRPKQDHGEGWRERDTSIIPRPDRLDIPLKRKKPTVYAVWSDLFHEAVPDDFIHKAYAQMRLNDKHTFLVVTKRHKRSESFLRQYKRVPLSAHPHIWHILTVCNQEEANKKIPIFLQIPGLKGLSIEPMLGEIDLIAIRWKEEDTEWRANVLTGEAWCDNSESSDAYVDGTEKIDAVILGGETGPGARPLHPDWVRSIRDQCAAAGVPFYFKQWGKHIPTQDCIPFNPKRELDGRTHDDLPWVKT